MRLGARPVPAGRLPSPRFYPGRDPAGTPGSASSQPSARRPPLPAPPAARCCRGPGTAQLHRGPMATRLRHRPSSSGQWGRGMGSAPTPRRPIAAWAGSRPPPPGGVAGRGRGGGRPPAPPRSPLTRCLVSPSSCSKPRGRAGAAKLREGARVASAAAAAAAWGRDPRAGQKFVRRSLPRGAHMATQAHSLSYAGCNFLRQRLVLSTLSGRPVKIRKIRARDDNPGLRGDPGRTARGAGAGAAGPACGEPPGPRGRAGGAGAAASPRRVRPRWREAGSGPEG